MNSQRRERGPRSKEMFFSQASLVFLALSALLRFTLEAAPIPKGSELKTPSKVTVKDEALLFKDLAGSIGGVGVVSPEEKRAVADTIEREKSWILRKTMTQIYEAAFDLYKEGKFRESLDVLDKIVALDPGYEQAKALHSALSDAASAGGRGGLVAFPKKARELVGEKFFAALATYREGRRVEAVQKFEEVLALDPKNRKAKFHIAKINTEIAKDYYEKGLVAKSQNRFEEALDHWYTAVSLDPKVYGFLSSEIIQMEETLRSRQLQRLLSEALRSLSNAKWNEARSQAKEMLRLDPSNKRANEIIGEALDREAQHYIGKGDALLGRKEFDLAIEEYEKVVKLGHRKQEAKEKIDSARSKIKQAEEDARRREEEDKARLEAEERAKAASGAGGEGAAGASSSRTQDAPPEASRASESHFQQAMVFYQAGDLQRSLEELSLALRFDPNNQNAYAAKRMIEQKLAR